MAFFLGFTILVDDFNVCFYLTKNLQLMVHVIFGWWSSLVKACLWHFIDFFWVIFLKVRWMAIMWLWFKVKMAFLFPIVRKSIWLNNEFFSLLLRFNLVGITVCNWINKCTYWRAPKSLVEPIWGFNYVELRKVGTWGPLPTSSTKRG